MDIPSKSLVPRVWEWSLLIMLFLALRIGGLFFFHPAFNNVCAIEELYRGAIGRELVNGLTMPYWHLRADDSGGGSLVLGVLAAVVFKLFGSSAFALKSVPVFLSLGTLLIWFRLLYREYSGKCAWYFSLFFVFSPTAFQSWSTAALGDHYESMFLSALSVMIFLKMNRMLSGQEIKTRQGDVLTPVVLLGILCGFGVWFAYIYSLTVLAILAVWFRKNPGFLKTKLFALFTVGFFIGFMPWVYINFHDGFGGLKIHGGYLWWHLYPKTAIIYWKRYFWELSCAKDIFAVFSHPALGYGEPRYFINWLYVFFLLATLLAWIALRVKKERPNSRCVQSSSLLGVFFAVYAMIHITAVQFTHFKAVRYLLPLMPALFFAWARGMTFLDSYSSSIRRWSRMLLALPVLGMGAFLWASILAPSNAGFLLRSPGYAYDYLASVPACNANPGMKNPDIDGCFHLYEKMMNRISSDNKKRSLNALAVNMAEIAVNRDNIPLKKFLQFQDASATASFYFHFGRFLFTYENQDLSEVFTRLDNMFQPSDPAFKLASMGVFYAAGSDTTFDVDFLSSPVWPRDRSEWYAAMGMQMGRIWRRSGKDIVKQIADMDRLLPTGSSEIDKAAFVSGVGAYFIQLPFEEPIRGTAVYDKTVQSLKPEYAEVFLKGAGRFYEINALFYPSPCETWACEYYHQDHRIEQAAWFASGKESVRGIVSEFIAADVSQLAQVKVS